MPSLLPPNTLRPGERWTAAYAADPWASRGRLTPEAPSATRTEFQRDRDRIIHSTAFRRLKHKTQVFLAHEGDHYRTRLTHTIEVAQIARSIARALGLDEDLAETLALAHDLGHTPFGHAGERALDRATAAHGGFDHNAQSLRVVTALERRYAAFDGLNLTWETLEGLVKHNGPLTDRDGRAITKHGLPGPIIGYDRRHPLELWSQASAEAQAAAIADDIAYNAHDIDDGLRAGILSHDELGENPFLAGLLREIRSRHPGLDRARVTHELQRRIITSLVEDVIAESRRRIASLSPTSAADIRAASTPVITFSAAILPAVESLRSFLYPKVYRHPKVMADMETAENIVESLYAAFVGDPTLMPADWGRDAVALDSAALARRVSDFIAGMTDLYAAERHRSLPPSAV
jgi:dGTPase